MPTGIATIVYVPSFVFLNLDPSPTAQSVAHRILRTGEFQVRPITFRRLMIVRAKEFISLSPLTIVLTIVMWESCQWLGKKFVRSNGERYSRKAYIGALNAVLFSICCNTCSALFVQENKICKKNVKINPVS